MHSCIHKVFIYWSLYSLCPLKKQEATTVSRFDSKGICSKWAHPSAEACGDKGMMRKGGWGVRWRETAGRSRGWVEARLLRGKPHSEKWRLWHLPARQYFPLSFRCCHLLNLVLVQFICKSDKAMTFRGGAFLMIITINNTTFFFLCNTVFFFLKFPQLWSLSNHFIPHW